MSRSCLSALFLTLASALAGAGNSGAAETPAKLNPDPGTFREITSGGTELSGDLVAGVMRGGGAFSENTVYVRIPKIRQPTALRLRILTSDGQYDGKATYTVPESASGAQVALVFAPRQRVLANMAVGKLVGLATMRDPATNVMAILPCSLNANTGNDPAVVYVNSSAAAEGGTLRVNVVHPQEGARSVSCERQSGSFIFDANFKVHPSTEGPVAVTIVRKYDGQIRDSLRFNLP